ncbi:receptor-type tyrosine-protein phosphatase epsilon-like isoform X1 [Saccostrea echinata]|uniref:receptor-type tyrosine-protein phosphatase epsilon-like isoform X1 n=1 Tax=Saccostrea echinata TaxID=191078 RepID=UPI002A8139F3|nr:receptor-type tyrosine-protein phosphatase epsilon-like isoform X1 [Saccostrea echinata]
MAPGLTTEPGPNTTAISNIGVSVDEGSDEILLWAMICAFVTFFGLGLATCKYFRDQYDTPENKKKRKDKLDLQKREKEEKAVAGVKREPIAAEQFLQKLKQKKSDKQLNIEVRAIVRNQDEFPNTVAMTPENILLNINQDVITYDHSRVILHDIPEDEGCSDYVNASYIDGYCQDKEYIATQGPKQKTVPSFWNMVWQEGVHCIVMATGLFENANQQCDKYWGDVFSMHKYVKHGNIHIWLESTMEISQLTIRTIRIQREGASTQRVVKHFEMIGFNDEGTDAGFVLDCRRRVHDFMLTATGPVLVHCRCGGGKTAVFIAVDYCLKELEAEGHVDVYSAVLHLRKFRKNMVRTLFQYRLIYECIAMYLQCGITVVPAVQFPAVASRLSVKDPRTRMLGFEKEFQTLKSQVTKLSIGDCAGGHRSENRSKSRDIMLLPPERARPYLLTAESSEHATDFINAVYVDGYYQQNNFLVTQWPLQHTIPDVWRLVFDYKITSFVLLNDSKFSRNYPCFWPTELDEEQKFGPIGVKYLGSHKVSHVTIRAFAIRKLPRLQYDSVLKHLGSDALNITCIPLGDSGQDTTIVKIFQLNSWPSKEKTPFSSKSLIYLMGFVEEWQQKTNPLNPVLVMSKDGLTRVGVYCACNYCCDQLKAEGEVDIFNAVRIVKKNRPALVPNVVEYIYCYSFIVFVIEIMQEDKPKIVITGPATKAGQVNRGYDFTNHILPEETSSLAATSDWSYVTAFDVSVYRDGSNLAARGRVTTSVSPVSQLQIPAVDKTPSSSQPNISSHRSLENTPSSSEQTVVSNRTRRMSERQSEENNNLLERSNSNGSSVYYSSASIESSSTCRAEGYTGSKGVQRKDIGNSRTRRPTLKRQNAEDMVELKSMQN